MKDQTEQINNNMNIDSAVDRRATNSCKVVSKYFSNNLVMDGSPNEVIKERQTISLKPQTKSLKTRKRSNKKVTGQKDIRTLIKSKKNELLTYTKDFDFVCKQSGIDVDPEQLQLAIALSNSLEDNKSANNDTTKTEKTLTCNQRRSKIKLTLQEYGFKTKTAPSKKVKKYRKQYKLVSIPDTEKQQRISDKYAEILIKNFTISKTHTEIEHNVDNSDACLYNLTTNITYNLLRNDEIFYVNELIPKSLYRECIFKDWSKIPGRPVSPKLEKHDINLKSIEWPLDQLDNILSGSFESIQDIMKTYYTLNTKHDEDILTKETGTNSCDSVETQLQKTNIKNSESEINQCSLSNKSIDLESLKEPYKMTVPVNRSCSPDLFDDEVTIIMDNSKDKLLVEKDTSERTILVRDQNDIMDLTDCVGVFNCNNPKPKHLYLSQGKDVTKINSNDYMDLTECVSACSEKKLNNARCIETIVNDYVDLNQPSTITITANKMKSNTNSDESSQDDTIIMIDEEYSNIKPISNQYGVNSIAKKSIFIDLIAGEYNTSDIKNTTTEHYESVVDSERNPKNETVNQFTNNNLPTIANYSNWNSVQNSKFIKNNKDLDTIDLTPSSNFNIDIVKSVTACERRTECDNSTNQPTSQQSVGLKFNKKKIDNGNKKLESLENIMNVEAMDLTQSSNSEDGSQYKPCVNMLANIITLNDDDCNSISHLERDDGLIDNLHLQYGCAEKIKNVNSNLIHNSDDVSDEVISKKKITNLDINSDREFDNVIQNICKGKRIIRKDNIRIGNTEKKLCTIPFQHESDNQEINLTQNSDCSSDEISVPDNLTNALGYRNYHAHSINNFTDEELLVTGIEEENNKICEISTNRDISQNSANNTTKYFGHKVKSNQSVKDYDNALEHVIVGENKDLSVDQVEISNIYNDVETNDIDLTQQSDSSVDTLPCPKIIEIPNELGKRNNISIDYDEIYVNNSIQRDITLESKIIETDNPSNEGSIYGSSQHSEVFELSDDEFNYSINQHIKDNISITLKQAKFDIGGVSTIDVLLSQNSMSEKSKLRCSCNSTGEPNTNNSEVENCLPAMTIQNNVSLMDDDVNTDTESCEGVQLIKISTPAKSVNNDDILIAKTPKHDDYIIKTTHVTPMPNYQNMTSPQRNMELEKFGIKPLKRKRAIQILTHIYNQTHPLMEEILEMKECASPVKIRRTENTCSPRRALLSQINSPIETKCTESSVPILDITDPLTETSSKILGEMSKNLKRSPQKNHVSNKDNSLNEETVVLPDIRDIECCPDDWVFQKREKVKVHSCRVPLHIALHNYVSSRPALRKAILKYEPVNIDDIHKGLVTAGYRYNPKDLLQFMDKKCITVKTKDISRKNRNN